MSKQKALREIRIIAWTLVGFCLSLAACSRKEPPEAEPVIPVQVAEAETAAIDRLVNADAILYPSNQSAVMPKINAPVREFRVNRGDHVHKGQLLAILENRDLAAAKIENQGLVKQAEAAYRSTTAASLPEEIEKAKLDLQSANQALEAAEKLYEGRKELLNEGAIARRLVDEANVAFVQARAQRDIAARHLDALQKVAQQEQVHTVEGQLEAAQGRFQGAEAQLRYSEITSPIDGVVTDRPIYAGEMATPGSPLLTIMDVSKVIARTNVPTIELKYIKLGSSASVVASDGTVTSGKVTVVSPAVDPNSTTAEVWVLIDNPGERLRPGETAHISIQAEKIQNAIVVPTTALVPSKDGGESVMVTDSASVAHVRRVTVGIRGPEKSQILDGIKNGEKVVIFGALGLQDNTKVVVQSAGKND